ncbi:hypothetical protein J9874_04071 (plasmid) [Duffyella gerundensis]|nr:hypothetical protein J9874_04071 [Duffyella gerundensis]
MNVLIMRAIAQPRACLPAYRTVCHHGSSQRHVRLGAPKLLLLSEAVTPCPANALSGQGAKTAAAADRLPSAIAMQHRAEMLERLIGQAETALASETARSYRRWYTCWRRRGVRVSDLLDMTWVWWHRQS